MADWTYKQGDGGPAYEDVLAYANGDVPDLEGGTLEFQMRAFTAAAPVVFTGDVTIVNSLTGDVRYDPNPSDETPPGNYAAVWRLTVDGVPMSFPTVGYISVTVEENLVTMGGAELVTVQDAKQYLGITAGDRTHDARLARMIRSARPTVENITGPIIPAEYDEWHTGGGSTLQVRRRPSSAPGTSPILELLTIDEYIGSQAHALTVVDTPSEGSTYSCMIDSLGTITRRTGGGGITSFAHDVHITYRAGQAVVPANVAEGTLELLRANWQTTRATGIGRNTVADDQTSSAPLHFYIPTKVAELLAPTRRHPSIA